MEVRVILLNIHGGGHWALSNEAMHAILMWKSHSDNKAKSIIITVCACALAGRSRLQLMGFQFEQLGACNPKACSHNLFPN